MKKKYPNWLHVSPKLIISEEQMDGTPDFMIYREKKQQWFTKWRSSAMRTGPYKTSGDAKRGVGYAMTVRYLGDTVGKRKAA